MGVLLFTSIKFLHTSTSMNIAFNAPICVRSPICCIFVLFERFWTAIKDTREVFGTGQGCKIPSFFLGDLRIKSPFAMIYLLCEFLGWTWLTLLILVAMPSTEFTECDSCILLNVQLLRLYVFFRKYADPKKTCSFSPKSDFSG